MSDKIQVQIEAAAAGDAVAMRDLLESVGPKLKPQLARKIGPQWAGLLDADDVLQVTYLEAFLQMRDLNARDEATFLSWLSRIAENNLRDAIRELSRKKRPPPNRRIRASAGEDSYVVLLEALGTTSATPSRQAARVEASTIIEHCLSQLPADYRDAVRMYDIEGRSATESADAMDRSIGAFHILRRRAHARLKSLVGSASQFFTDAG